MKPAKFYLIRGLGRESGHWGSFVKELGQQSYVSEIQCLELPGAGKYHKLSSPLKISEYAEFLKTQIDENSKEPKVVLSVSLGSMVAVELGQIAPELFKKIYIMNSSFSNLSPFYHRLQLRALKRFYEMARSKSLKERELECLKMVSHKNEVWEQLAEDYVKIGEARPFAIKNLFRQLIAAATYRVGKNRPQVPVVVLNSQGDEMVHPSCSEKIADHWNLPLHTHPDAGHDIAIDAPQWIFKIIQSTL